MLPISRYFALLFLAACSGAMNDERPVRLHTGERDAAHEDAEQAHSDDPAEGVEPDAGAAPSEAAEASQGAASDDAAIVAGGDGASAIEDVQAVDAGAAPDAAHAEGTIPEADSGAPQPCGADGVSCVAGDTGGVCCGGQCLEGNCCTADDCGGAAFLCEGQRCLDVAASLSGLLWKLPCTGTRTDIACVTEPNLNVSTRLGGKPGTTYDLTLHFLGAVERKSYPGSCGGGDLWHVGGTPASDIANVYRLEISAPAQVFYLNGADVTDGGRLTALDLTRHIRAQAGARITLFADAIDGYERMNVGASWDPVTIQGTSVAQPFDGQFIEMQVVEVRPIMTAPEEQLSAGVQLQGAQFLSVPDAPSLHAADVTLEGWFLESAAPAAYGTLIGKPYLGATADSFALWVQSGKLLGGAELSNPTGAAATPQAPDAYAWHHAAVSVDRTAGTSTLYLDGVARGCGAAPAAITYDAQPVLLGADIDNGVQSGFWIGALDELRVFSAARSADQIWTDMYTHRLGPTDTLVGEWLFDEMQGQTAADSSGFGNHAVLGKTGESEPSDPAWIHVRLP